MVIEPEVLTLIGTGVGAATGYLVREVYRLNKKVDTLTDTIIDTSNKSMVMERDRADAKAREVEAHRKTIETMQQQMDRMRDDAVSRRRETSR